MTSGGDFRAVDSMPGAASLHGWAGVVGQARVATMATAVGVFAAAVALLAVVQWATPGIVGNDGYYHIKILEAAADDPLLQKIYRDDYAVIYYVVVDRRLTAMRLGVINLMQALSCANE